MSWNWAWLLCLGWLLSGSLSAQTESHAAGAQQTAPAEWEHFIESAGVALVLDQANDLIEQEIRNLEKAPLGFTPQQLVTLRNQFRQQLGPEQLKQDIVRRLQRDFSPQQRAELQAVLASSKLQQLQTLQQQLDDASVRRAVRAYRLKV
ncbi:MAG: hypothetical protein ABF318_01625, partial [Ketobacter sp.]